MREVIAVVTADVRELMVSSWSKDEDGARRRLDEHVGLVGYQQPAQPPHAPPPRRRDDREIGPRSTNDVENVSRDAYARDAARQPDVRRAAQRERPRLGPTAGRGAFARHLLGELAARVDRLVVAGVEEKTDRDVRAAAGGQLERGSQCAAVIAVGVLCNPDVSEHAPYDMTGEARAQ